MIDGMGVPKISACLMSHSPMSLGTSTTGAGTLGDFFSSAEASTCTPKALQCPRCSRGSTYKWTISYTGNITLVGREHQRGRLDQRHRRRRRHAQRTELNHRSGRCRGDYNDDDKVDAADYVVWRKNETANDPLPNDNGAATSSRSASHCGGRTSARWPALVRALMPGPTDSRAGRGLCSRWSAQSGWRSGTALTVRDVIV